jgi:hypothetical protein
MVVEANSPLRKEEDQENEPKDLMAGGNILGLCKLVGGDIK